jgi:hypothetical protein
MWISRQELRLEKSVGAAVGKRVISLNHYLAIYGDPIPYAPHNPETLRAILQKDICENCYDRACRKIAGWVVGCLPSKSDPNRVHLTAPRCENWRIWVGEPLCWARSDQITDPNHGILVFPCFEVFAALMVLEFPAYHKFFNDIEEVWSIKLDRANGWDYFVVPPQKAVKGENLKSVIIDTELGLLKQVHGNLIILKGV